MVLLQLLRGQSVLCSEEVRLSTSQMGIACWIKHGPFRYLMKRTLCEDHLSLSHVVSTSVGMLPEAIAKVLKCLLCCVGCTLRIVGFRSLQTSGAVRIISKPLSAPDSTERRVQWKISDRRADCQHGLDQGQICARPRSQMPSQGTQQQEQA